MKNTIDIEWLNLPPWFLIKFRVDVRLFIEHERNVLGQRNFAQILLIYKRFPDNGIVNKISYGLKQIHLESLEKHYIL